MLLFGLFIFTKANSYDGFCYSPSNSTGDCPSNLIKIENISQFDELNPEINSSIETIQLLILSSFDDQTPAFNLSCVNNYKLHVYSNSKSEISISFDNENLSLFLSNIIVYIDTNKKDDYQINLHKLILSNVQFYSNENEKFLSMKIDSLFSDLDSLSNTTKIETPNPTFNLMEKYHDNKPINVILMPLNQKASYTLIGFSTNCILICEEDCDTITFGTNQDLIIQKPTDVSNFVSIINQNSVGSIKILATSSKPFEKNDFLGQPHFTFLFNTSNIQCTLPSFDFAELIGHQFQFQINKQTADNCLIKLNKLLTTIEIIDDLSNNNDDVLTLHLLLMDNVTNIYRFSSNCPFNLNVDSQLPTNSSMSITTINSANHQDSNFLIKNDNIVVYLNTLIVQSTSGTLKLTGEFVINGRINAYSNSTVVFSSLTMKEQLIINIHFDIQSYPFISVTNGNTRNELLIPLEIVFAYTGLVIPYDEDCLYYLHHNNTFLQLGAFPPSSYYVHLDPSVPVIGFSSADSVMRFVYGIDTISFYLIGFPSVIYSYVCYGDKCFDYLHSQNDVIPYLVICNKTTLPLLKSRLQWFTKSFYLYLAEEMEPDYVLNFTSDDIASVRTNPISIYLISLIGKTKLTITFSDMISKYINMFFLNYIYIDVPSNTPKDSLNCLFNWMQLGATTNFSENALNAMNFDKIKNVAVDVQCTPFLDIQIFKQEQLFLIIDRENTSYFTFENNTAITIDSVTINKDSRLIYYVFTPLIKLSRANQVKNSIEIESNQKPNFINTTKFDKLSKVIHFNKEFKLKNKPDKKLADYFELEMFLANRDISNMIFEGEWPSSTAAVVLYASSSSVINVYSESQTLPLSIIPATDLDIRIGNIQSNQISTFTLIPPLFLMNYLVSLSLLDNYTKLILNNCICAVSGGRAYLETDRVLVNHTKVNPSAQCSINNGIFQDSIEIYHGGIASFNLSDMSSLNTFKMYFYNDKFPTLILRGVPTPNNLKGNYLPKRIDIESSLSSNVTAVSGSYHIISGNIVRCSELVEDDVLHLNTKRVNDGKDTVQLECGDGGDVLLVISENGSDDSKPKNNSKFIILIVVASFVLIVLIVAFVVIFYVKRKKENNETKYYDVSIPLTGTSDSIEIKS